MVNNRKVRLMTKLSIYENGKGKEDLELSKYFRRDYLRNGFLKTFVAVTIGFAFIVGLRILYKMEYIVSHAVVLNYQAIISQIVGLYLVLLTIFSMSGLVYGMIHYNRSRNRFSKYFRMLKRMRSFYKEEEDLNDGGRS